VDEELRCWIYASLAEMFADVPRDLEPPPAGPDMEAPARQAVAAVCEALRSESAEDVAADHVRLFVNAPGGVPAPPYAGWYLDGALGGPSRAHVAEAYARQCLEVAEDAGQPADSIATELEFLHLLCRHQLAARTTNDAPAFAAARDAEAAFLLGHFCRWVPRFASAIRDAAPGPVFGSVAELLACLCTEAERLTRALPGGSAGPAMGAMDRSAHTDRSHRRA
jgi:TorA maturation chaperone TorD